MGCVIFFATVVAVGAAARRYELDDLLEYLNITYVVLVFSIVNVVVRLINLSRESS